MNNLESGNIQFSKAATDYLRGKIAFFRSKARAPRIVLTGRSCHGAEFRLFFEVPQADDLKIAVEDIFVYVPAGLLNEFGGFDVDVEQFFFAKRIQIVPQKQSYSCDCDHKCKDNKIIEEL